MRSGPPFPSGNVTTSWRCVVDDTVLKFSQRDAAPRYLSVLVALDMTHARGLTSRTLLDRENPHQVMVLAETLRGPTLDRVINFHMNLGIPTKSRSIRKEDAWYALYYFANFDHAKLFRVMFGGNLVSQK